MKIRSGHSYIEHQVTEALSESHPLLTPQNFPDPVTESSEKTEFFSPILTPSNQNPKISQTNLSKSKIETLPLKFKNSLQFENSEIKTRISHTHFPKSKIEAPEIKTSLPI